MQKRNTQQRRRSIVDRLIETGEVSVEDLTKQFNTSEVTIRKDLTELEKNGFLIRKYGGAVLVPQESSALTEQEISIRKKAIAETASNLIQDFNRIVIDSGSTTSALLPELHNKKGLIVMTNALHVANYLLEMEHEPTVLMTGGTWDNQSHSFQGQMAEKMLRAYNFDQAFVGAAGLDIEQGTTTFNELTQLSKVMSEVSREVIVMAESEKLQRKIPNVELPWKSITTLVTDDLISEEAKTAIENQGVTVICARVASINIQ